MSESETIEVTAEASVAAADDATSSAALASAKIDQHWQEQWARERSFAAPASDDARIASYISAGLIEASAHASISQIRGYAIADAYARFLRASGRGVLFSLGLDVFGARFQQEALARGVDPGEWAEACRERIHRQFESLGLSCDWERVALSSDPDQYRWTQRLFLGLLERDLIYERDDWVLWCASCDAEAGACLSRAQACPRCSAPVRPARLSRWFLRAGGYLEECERGLERLAGWSERALNAQRAAIGGVDGVELDATTLDGHALTVFTPHADAIDKATFVAVSPVCAEAQRWTAEPELAEQLARLYAAGLQLDSSAGDAQVVQTGTLASVPGVDGVVPIVLSPLVDARFGPTVALGVPERDAVDRAIADCLTAMSSTAWKVSTQRAASRAAVRYREADIAISSRCAWGPAVPLIDCAACGAVAARTADLPLALAEPAPGSEDHLSRGSSERDCCCPQCGGAARRDERTIDRRFDAMWAWLPICVPPSDRRTKMLDSGECSRWLPADQLIGQLDAGREVLDQRIGARILRDIAGLSGLTAGEPFSNLLEHQAVRAQTDQEADRIDDPVRLVDEWSADVVRLAIIHAASPGRAVKWSERNLQESERFLTMLSGYLAAQLESLAARDGEHRDLTAIAIDTADRLRRRLAHWSEVARVKVTEALAALELQRAAHNSMLLLTRIQDFERRVVDRRGALEPADREAIVAALLLLVRLLSPLTPHVAEELWSRASGTGMVVDLPWPGGDRQVEQVIAS